jgi:hypothetical protein
MTRETLEGIIQDLKLAGMAGEDDEGRIHLTTFGERVCEAFGGENGPTEAFFCMTSAPLDEMIRQAREAVVMKALCDAAERGVTALAETIGLSPDEVGVVLESLRKQECLPW